MKSDVALTPLSSIQFIVRDNQSSCKVPVQKAAIAGRSVYQGQILQQFLPQYLHPSSAYIRHGLPPLTENPYDGYTNPIIPYHRKLIGSYQIACKLKLLT